MATRPRKNEPAGEDLAEYRKKRDFSKTSEPSGGSRTSDSANLRFVIQKHRASHLHFDLRLELDGVMKSWAVPKGPSTDPSVKRLAMQVEDHPIEYNSFEGTIPKGEYGGGTVMLWDQGTYTPEDTSAPDHADAIRAGYEKGDLKITFLGDRMQGSWVLVRMEGERSKSSSKPQWLFIKHRDDFVSTDNIVAEFDTSVTTDRSMDEIESGDSKVWHSNKSPETVRRQTPAKTPTQPLEPMYASLGKSVPEAGWTFEPKYDGIRVLAYVTPDETMLMTRNGKNKAPQFPEIIEALQAISNKKNATHFVVDGEIVALADGDPARFQKLQSRMHVKESSTIDHHRETSPAALILFDMLAIRDEILLAEPWIERRTRLVDEMGEFAGNIIRITESFEGDGEAMLGLAHEEGWEGVIAKRIDSIYEPGRRSRDWLKLKIESRQEFVVGGFTEPRNSRQHIGALLLGYYDHGRFIYVGHTGGGFTDAGLAEMFELLDPLEQDESPFEEVPKTNERAHWVSPRVVVEVKFNEWTSDGKLRQPI
ncbi:MAG: non-homologous end-joining DNA ligase, partial [Gemmatimonadaceae bacterium]